MVNKRIAFAVVSLMALGASADVYYWRGAGSTMWADWSNISSGGWSLAKESHVAPPHVPGTDSSDFLWSYGVNNKNYIGYFNLGGGSYTLAGYSGGGVVSEAAPWTWQWYALKLTNGTLTVSNAQKPIAFTAMRYELFNGVTLNVSFPSGWTPRIVGVGENGLYEQWYVRSGARMNVQTYAAIISLDAEVSSGGTLNLANGTFNILQNAHVSYPNKIANSGTLLLPNGLEWVEGDPWSPKTDYSKVMDVTQKAGEVRFGGDFKKTGVDKDPYKVRMRFILQGGTLTTEADSSVAFLSHVGKNGEEVFAEMPASASATVQTLAGSTLDMSHFTYGSGAALTKAGAGTLVLKDRPSTVNVAAGTLKFTNAVSGLAGVTVQDGGALLWPPDGSDFAGLALAEGAKIVFDRTGATATSVPEDYPNAVFALDNSGNAFALGSTVVASANAAFLAHVAESLNGGTTLPNGLAAAVSGAAVRLVTPLSHVFSSEGELDIGTASGWSAADYEGKDVLVSGASTVALITPDSPAFSSITLSDGATLKVSGADVELPPVTLITPSTLLVPNGSSAVMTNGFASAGDVGGLPIVQVETNGVLTVARGTRFKNVAIRLYGEIGVPKVTETEALRTDMGITFGHADAGETTYFAMTSIGGNINISGNQQSSTSNPGATAQGMWFAYGVPGSGNLAHGRVNVTGDILLKDTTFKVPSGCWRYVSKRIGGYNDSGFTMVFDNTELPIERYCDFKSGRLVFRNGGRLVRPYTHPGTATWLRIDRLVTAEFTGSDSGILMPYSNVGNTFYEDIWLDSNPVQMSFRDGAFLAAHHITGGVHQCVAFSNGVYQVGTLPFVSADRNPNPPDGDPRNWMTDAFNGMRSVKIEDGGKLFFQSARVLGGTEWDRYITLAARPIIGGGDFVMTNGVPGRGFAATVTAGNNSATGSISVAPSADPTTLYFNDGANWAGTVVAGNVALTNLTAAAEPATVSFATLDLAGDFPIRIWNDNGTFTNDMVNITTALTGAGAIEPVLEGGLKLAGGETFTLGVCPAAGISTANPREHVKRNWKLLSESAAGGNVRLLLKYQPIGTVLSVR